ncbi:MAG: hypothetical protein Q4C34_04900 [Bacteroidales bacterium]|nr:hypothetical protein [Bacteroidales bacterium]
MWPVEAYKRWRHGRGFGVHSPYAYRMVSEVLRPQRGYGYYAYGAIVRSISREKASVDVREALMIFRLVLALRPATVALKCDDRAVVRVLERVVALACPSARLADDGEMLLCIGRADAGNCHSRHAYFSDSGNPALASLAAGMTAGHIYRNPRRAVVAGESYLPLQTFEIAF